MNLTHLKRLVVALVGAALLAACGSSQQASGPHQFTASGYGPYKPATVALTDTAGAPYDLGSTLQTPLTLVFFGYTNCPDECPAVMSQLGSAFSRLSADQTSKITMVFVTTDPARDSAKVERRWLDRYDSRFIGVTGPIARIIDLASSLKLYVKGAERLPSGGYDVPTHDTHVVALNARHVAVAIWDIGTTSKQYAGDLQAMLNGAVPE
ncbi:hypothetical protein Back2_05380 [Nocardioides baekrokdamisoli]|uniref:SCO family protein n=1 Tax=Nocardioides baekrokdamisoli TaxID=1804624 RepID=A0A3G9IRJ4_9ACTN|nr:SCO family protein [Nocardioides baekrokdamisoli]BBH16251.1 hypothetical protein Back2_05380 [Nocardioides baekrokdamisoli]